MSQTPYGYKQFYNLSCVEDMKCFVPGKETQCGHINFSSKKCKRCVDHFGHDDYEYFEADSDRMLEIFFEDEREYSLEDSEHICGFKGCQVCSDMLDNIECNIDEEYENDDDELYYDEEDEDEECW